MNEHIFGFVHQAYHQNAGSWEHIKRMQYRGATVFQNHYRDEGYVRSLLDAMPSDAIYIARDHPLTEQHGDLDRGPKAAGIDHANQYIKQVKEGRYLLPLEQTYFAGLNEVSTYSNLEPLIEYDLAFLHRLSVHPDVREVPTLRGAGLRISTGHPPTYDYTPNTVANWEPFDPVIEAIIEGEHIAEIHEYGRADDLFVGDNILRFKHLHRFDFDIVIGEVGFDDAVNRKEGWPHHGYRVLPGDPRKYAKTLDVIHTLYTGFPNVLAAFLFVGDHASPWETFDVFQPDMQRALEEQEWTWARATHPCYAKWEEKMDGGPPVLYPPPVQPPEVILDDWRPDPPKALKALEFIRMIRHATDELEKLV